MHIVSSDIDWTQIPAKNLQILDQDPAYPASIALKAIVEKMQQAGHVRWVHNSGRSLPHILQDVLPSETNPKPILILPAAIIANVGTEIYVLQDQQPILLQSWQKHLAEQFAPQLRIELETAFKANFAANAEVRLQPPAHQGPFKLSYKLTGDRTEATAAALDTLFEKFPGVRTTFSGGWAYDVTPERATKGTALEHLADHWGIPHAKCIVAGDSGNDAEMYRPAFRGIVVGNAKPELLARLPSDRQGIHFAAGHVAAGVLEGMHALGLFPTPQPPVRKVPLGLPLENRR